MKYIKNKALIAFLVLLGINAFGQELDQLMAETDEKKTDYAFATFKGTRILNGQSVEGLGKGVLQVMFQHRFSPINNGIYDFFGLDGAVIRFGFDYGITNRLTVGIGRTTDQKAYDGYFKLKMLRQSSGKINMPLSVSLFGSSAIRTTNAYNPTDAFKYRLFYTAQLIIARKFSPAFSVQFMPTFIHRNLTLNSTDKNSIFSLGIAFRYKVTKRSGIVAECYYTFPNQLDASYHSMVAALGWEIETGGHVYHLLFTNASGMLEHQFIGYNSAPLSDGLTSIRFGFNLSRVFTVLKNVE